MKRLLLLLFLLTLAGCSELANHDLAEQIATNSDVPWAIDFNGTGNPTQDDDVLYRLE